MVTFESNGHASTDDLRKGEMVDGEFRKSSGMNWFLAGFFLVGAIAGGGIVALPTAVQQCGLHAGVVVCLLMAAVATTSAILLGRSWMILVELWPEYRTHCRNPYAEIGYRALGLKAKSLVSLCVNLNQFGGAVVFFLLPAKNIHDFVAIFTPHGPDLCTWLLILGVCMLPVVMLKSPEDFWWTVIAGMGATSLAVVLIVVGAARDHAACAPSAVHPPFRATNLFAAFGTIVFTFCSHATYPQVLSFVLLMLTIQHDMRRPAQFTRSAILAYGIVLTCYASVVITALTTYGDSLRDSVINSIQTPWIQQAVNMMIAAHCILNVALTFNPLNQEVEEYFGIPQGFGWHRVAVRGAILAAVVFTAESVPSFGPVMSLMGASTFTLICIVFPPTFYVFLVARKRSGATGQAESCGVRDTIRLNDRPILALTAFFILVGAVCGTTATWAATVEITSTRFEVPCYVRAFTASGRAENFTSTPINCCGPFQNISVRGQLDGYCNAPQLDFYG
ncbi:Aa-trans domain-containing protein [Aphelenchoides fujianensis]|nr:Aa-trans domain-containing protein [Aphelenchoides fujianensis]